MTTQTSNKTIGPAITITTCPHCGDELNPNTPQTSPPMGHCPVCGSSFIMCSKSDAVRLMCADWPKTKGAPE